MKELIVEVGFTTDVMGKVSKIALQFSEEDLTAIREHRMYLMKNKDIFKIVLEFDGELLDEDGERSDFRGDGGELFIFEDRLYFFTQSRYDASVQVESQEIPMTELFDEDELDDDYRSTLTCDDCASDVNLCTCKEMTVDKAREFLRENGWFTQNMWSTTDVIDHASNLDYEVTEEQAIEIFDLVGRYFDAEIGVNWDTLAFAIEEYFNENR